MDAQPPCMERKTTIKVSMNGDTRRIQVTLPTDASSDSGCQVTFAAIRRAVSGGYNVAEDSLPSLKYRDEDGDLCTLAVCTVPDLLVLANGGPLRLVADAGVVDSAVDIQKDQEEVQTTEPEAEFHFIGDDKAQEEELTVADATTAETAPDVAAEDTAQRSAEAEEEPAVTGAAAAEAAASGDVEATQQNTQSEEELAVADASVAEVRDSESAANSTLSSALVSSDSVGRLVEMGFPEDKARDALAVCQGDEARAVESLLSGGEDSSPTSHPDFFTGLHNLLLQVKGRLTELREQLREVAGRHWERRHEHREHAQEEGRRRLKQLQESIADLRAKLRQLNQEWKGSAHGAAEKVRARFEEHVTLEKLDAQLEDAQQFLGDSLVALQGRASGILQRVLSSASNAEATEEEQAVAEVDRAEAAEAVTAASESAALAAIDTVDEFLVGMDNLSDGEENPRMRALSQGAAQAQDFLAKAFAKMHGKASEILGGNTGSAGSTESSTGEASDAPLFRGNDTELAPEAIRVDLPTQEGTPPDEEKLPEDTQEAPEDGMILVDATPNESSDQPSA